MNWDWIDIVLGAAGTAFATFALAVISLLQWRDHRRETARKRRALSTLLIEMKHMHTFLTTGLTRTQGDYPMEDLLSLPVVLEFLHELDTDTASEILDVSRRIRAYNVPIEGHRKPRPTRTRHLIKSLEKAISRLES